MEAYLHAWLALLLRWAHFIAGVAWIGASFYFNWLENHLERSQQDKGVAGDLWAIHGGGFYYLKKFELAPESLPGRLHWFKWEAYATWLTGFALLCVVYYWNAPAFLLDVDSPAVGAPAAVVIGLASLLLSWILYDRLCRSSWLGNNAWAALCMLGWFGLLAWALEQVFSGRAAYIHVGAAMGTIMVANVFRVIIPSQRDLVEAVAERRRPDARKGAEALQRSRHNNYFTLPVLFIMISSHYPQTFGHAHGWLVLLVLSAAGVLVRHYFNVRHLESSRWWPLATGLLLLGGLVAATAPQPRQARPESAAGVTEAWAVVQQRCVSCHARKPANAAFSAAPLGIELDTRESLEGNAARVYTVTVVNRTMPLGNLTQMTEQERAVIAGWYENRADGAR